eukprot:TRINITY_DN9801_c0_g1_i3.p1 TRINITY_DN9801_c0_g1~~TRINITY_DN9801_c0_g1_i3.p1  ORF type:complete len:526 (+),score=74.69 TRINITY_DN9801_c0_g1_i3:63-1640(+)
MTLSMPRSCLVAWFFTRVAFGIRIGDEIDAVAANLSGDVGGCGTSGHCCVCRHYRNNEFWKECHFPKKRHAKRDKTAVSFPFGGTDYSLQLCCMWNTAEKARLKIQRGKSDRLRYRFIASHCLGEELAEQTACESDETGKPLERKHGVRRLVEILKISKVKKKAGAAWARSKRRAAKVGRQVAQQVAQQVADDGLVRTAMLAPARAHHALTLGAVKVGDRAATAMGRGLSKAGKAAGKYLKKSWNNMKDCATGGEGRMHACWETVKLAGNIAFVVTALWCPACNALSLALASATWTLLKLAGNALDKHSSSLTATQNGGAAVGTIVFALLATAGGLAAEALTGGFVTETEVEAAAFSIQGFLVDMIADVQVSDVISYSRMAVVSGLKSVLDWCMFLKQTKDKEFKQIVPEPGSLPDVFDQKMHTCFDVWRIVTASQDASCQEELPNFLRVKKTDLQGQQDDNDETDAEADESQDDVATMQEAARILDEDDSEDPTTELDEDGSMPSGEGEREGSTATMQTTTGDE